MTIYTINPDTWTKIGDGDCVVISEYRTELVYFRLDNGESVTSYLGKQLLVKNTGDLFAKSNRRTIEVKSTAADAAVRKNAADIITTNTALTANTDKDLETKNALEAKDVLLEQRIDETDGIVVQNKIDQAGIDSAQDTIIGSNTQAITDNKTELDAKDVLIEQSIADNALADSELDGLVSTLSTDLSNLTLRVTALEDVPKVVVLTQEDYDALLEKEVGTLYVIGVLG